MKKNADFKVEHKKTALSCQRAEKKIKKKGLF